LVQSVDARRWQADADDRPASICYDPDMAHRLELAAKRLAFERVATGGFVVIAPARAIGTLTTPGYDTEAARYVARLLGIRQVVLGVMLWQTRNDRARLRQVATLNALTEVLDAAATLASVGQRRSGRPSAAPPSRRSQRQPHSSPFARRRPELGATTRGNQSR
jgi:hypothetical protein